jgi:tetratricopeptide (TPR) repeat protein
MSFDFDTFPNVSEWSELLEAIPDSGAAMRAGIGLEHRGEARSAALVYSVLATEAQDEATQTLAALRLAALYRALGMSSQSELALEKLNQKPADRLSAAVNLDLAARAEVLGRREEAHWRYHLVMTEPGRFRGLAAYRLGCMVAAEHQAEQARAFFGYALQWAEDDLLPYVLVDLAAELAGSERTEEQAVHLYRQAIATDHADLAPAAALALGLLYERRYEFEEAQQLYELVVECEHPDCAPEAFARLAALALMRFDDDDPIIDEGTLVGAGAQEQVDVVLRAHHLRAAHHGTVVWCLSAHSFACPDRDDIGIALEHLSGTVGSRSIGGLACYGRAVSPLRVAKWVNLIDEYHSDALAQRHRRVMRWYLPASARLVKFTGGRLDTESRVSTCRTRLESRRWCRS